MEYCFDSIFVKNGKIFATGWAVSSVAENEIEITVIDEKKTPVVQSLHGQQDQM